MTQIIADFRVEQKADLYHRLDDAVTVALTVARVDRTHGVLVTRHDFGHYSVSLSPKVPFGLIQENDQAGRN